MEGKRLRMRRFIDRTSRRGVIVPLDHGLTMGPIDGLQNVARIGTWLTQPGINGVIVHKGMAERLANRNLLDDLALMVHLNGMHSLSPTANRKEVVTSVRSGLRLGADAVSIQVNFDGSNDTHNLKLIGSVVDEAMDYGLPVLAMLYDKVTAVDRTTTIKRMRHFMRLAIELGCDALKIAMPNEAEDVAPLLADLVDDALIFFAGGAKTTDTALISITQAAVAAGAAGLCIGRNIFQRPAPSPLLGELNRVLHSPHLAPLHGGKEIHLGVH